MNTIAGALSFWIHTFTLITDPNTRTFPICDQNTNMEKLQRRDKAATKPVIELYLLLAPKVHQTSFTALIR